MFQIVEAMPVHCQITDGIIGTRYVRHPMTYHRGDTAHKLAGAFDRRNYENCGDSTFFVIEAGAPVINAFGRPNCIGAVSVADDFDGMPF